MTEKVRNAYVFYTLRWKVWNIDYLPFEKLYFPLRPKIYSDRNWKINSQVHYRYNIVEMTRVRKHGLYVHIYKYIRNSISDLLISNRATGVKIQ
jgi:hypothetical protein